MAPFNQEYNSRSGGPLKKVQETVKEYINSHTDTSFIAYGGGGGT